MRNDVPNPSPYAATFDLDRNGKQFGHISIPHSRDDAGWGSLMVPIISIRSGHGPCLLLTAGSHGDEFEGQIALRNLVLSLDPDDVNGQIIVVPALNLPAVLNNSRLSPIDGGNMNRVFPGDRRGSLTEKVASYVYDELVHRADFVIDLHAAGRNLNALPCALIHFPHYLQNREIFHRSLDAAKAFAAPTTLILEEPDPPGLLDTAVEALGKIFVCTELGGYGAVTPNSIAIAERGVRNLIKFFGLMDGELEKGESPTEVMETPEGAFVLAEDGGIFEPFVELGDMIAPRQPIGRMHSITHPDRQPVVHHAEAGGRLIVRRTAARTTHGDCLTCVARPYEPR